MAPAAASPVIEPVPQAVTFSPVSSAVDYESTLWGQVAIRSSAANSVSKGDGVLVAVIDTGVDAQHPDLRGRVRAGWSTVTGKAFAAGAATDGGEHGTHVAGIIAGAADRSGIAGVAPHAEILPVQVLDENGSGSDKTVADGIDWAVAQGATVINLSLGGSTNPFDKGGSKSCAAVGRAFDAGVVVIVAAGNAGGAGNPRNEPASCRGAMSVAAVDENLNRTSFSSYDASVAIAAPGAAIISSIPTSNRFPYAQWDGTSMAAPFVAGVAALLRSAHPDWTAQQVVDALVASAVDLGPVGSDPEYGAGIVDAARALGLPRVQRSEIIAAIASATVPVVASAASDGKTLNVRWEAPEHVVVSSYEIVTVTDDVLSTTSARGDAGSIVIVSNRFPEVITIRAVVAPGDTRTSTPFIDVVDNRTFESTKVTTVVTKAYASWTTKGLKLSFSTKGPRTTVRVSLNAFSGDFFIYESLDSSITSKTFPLAADDPARGQTITISVSTEIGSKDFSLAPQYAITARTSTAGAGWYAVSGTTREACSSAKKSGCSGSSIELRDSKTNAVIAKSWVLASLAYGFYVPSKKITGPVYVAVGSFKSSLLTWKRG